MRTASHERAAPGPPAVSAGSGPDVRVGTEPQRFVRPSPWRRRCERSTARAPSRFMVPEQFNEGQEALPEPWLRSSERGRQRTGRFSRALTSTATRFTTRGFEQSIAEDGVPAGPLPSKKVPREGAVRKLGSSFSHEGCTNED